MRLPVILGGEPVSPMKVAFSRPFLPPLESVMLRLAPSYDQGILTNGPLVRLLEESVADRLGTPHAVAVSSATSGLMLALRAMVARGRVVLPSFTFSATAHAVAWNGLEPVFADCDPASFQLDPAETRQRVAGADAIVATHIFGVPAPAEELEAVARAAGVPLLFDAAHAFGAMRGEQPVGTFGHATVFSMSPTKLVVGGEGGIVATASADLAQAIRLGRDYGNPGDYDCEFAGLSARLSEMHAAMALESLALLDEHLARRRAVVGAYCDALEGMPGIAVQATAPGDEPSWMSFTVTVDESEFGLPRDVVVSGLRAEGIDVRCYFSPPVHRQHAYAALSEQLLPATDLLASRVISLPMHASLRTRDVHRVVEALAGLHHHASGVLDAISVPV